MRSDGSGAVAIPAEEKMAEVEEEQGSLQQHPKKRARNPTEWKREKRKRLRIAGQEYINSRGDLVQARSIGDDCKCRRKCYTKVSEENRLQLFEGYYDLNSHDEQNAYLYGLIRKHDIARKRSKNSDRRTCTYKYFVRLRGKEIQVCRLAFAHIHGISPHKIRILCQKMDQNIMYPRDRRGKHDNRPKKIAKETIQHIKEHIYSVLRSDRVRDFVKEEKNNGPDVNITRMWKDYLSKYDPQFHLYTSHGRSKNRLWAEPDTMASEMDIVNAANPSSSTDTALDIDHLTDREPLSSDSEIDSDSNSELELQRPQLQHQQQQLPQSPGTADSASKERDTKKKKKNILEPAVKHWLYSKVFHEEFKFHDFLQLKRRLWEVKSGTTPSPSKTGQGSSAAGKSERKQKTPKKILRDKLEMDQGEEVQLTAADIDEPMITIGNPVVTNPGAADMFILPIGIPELSLQGYQPGIVNLGGVSVNVTEPGGTYYYQ